MAPGYGQVREDFQKSANRLQKVWSEKPYPILEGKFFMSGYDYQDPEAADVQRGDGTGYGTPFL